MLSQDQTSPNVLQVIGRDAISETTTVVLRVASDDGFRDRLSDDHRRAMGRPAGCGSTITLAGVGLDDAADNIALDEVAEHADLADAGLADEDDRGTLVERVDDGELGRRHPQLALGNPLKRRRVLATEVREVSLAFLVSCVNRSQTNGE
jgi:hypothetical protein